MIVVPYKTPAFYSVLAEKPAASFLCSLLSPTYGQAIDVVQFLSRDMDSDVEATVELQDAINTVSNNLDIGEIDQQLQFNPMYLPTGEDLNKNLEYDSEGDVITVGGFVNPYTTAELKLSATNHPTFLNATINYQPFTLPSMSEMLSSHNRPPVS